LVQFALGKLLDMFPHKDFSAVDIDEYNRHLSFEFEHIRDFLILHYQLNQRTDSRFWRDCRAMSVPIGLQRKLDLFKANGRIYREAEELFTELGWLQVMLGQGIVPQRYHPMADTLSEAQLEEFLSTVSIIIDKALALMPSHRKYISQHCAAA